MMPATAKGEKVRHKASRRIGIVTKINGEKALVSFDGGKDEWVALVALERVEEENQPFLFEVLR